MNLRELSEIRGSTKFWALFFVILRFIGTYAYLFILLPQITDSGDRGVVWVLYGFLVLLTIIGIIMTLTSTSQIELTWAANGIMLSLPFSVGGIVVLIFGLFLSGGSRLNKWLDDVFHPEKLFKDRKKKSDIQELTSRLIEAEYGSNEELHILEELRQYRK